MDIRTRNASVVVPASTAIPLPEDAVYVESVAYMAEGATAFSASSLTVGTSAPTSTDQIQFTGTPATPSKTLTLKTAPGTAGGLMQVSYAPVGALPANV